MEITLFSKCLRELIIENDRVDVPYLGTFLAEMMPASYSGKQTTIHPPYRKISFHKGEVSLSDGRLLLDKVRREIGVSLNQAGVELGWCLSRLCSELEGRKSCKLPGLGVMRANARNEFFFVPDDDLDLWPDGIGFEPIAIKVSEKPSDTGERERVAAPARPVAEKLPAETPSAEMPSVDTPPAEPSPAVGQPPVADPFPAPAPQAAAETPKPERPVTVRFPRRSLRPLHPLQIVLIVLGALLALFIAASFFFTEQMSPILDPLLYSKEELELLGR